MENIKNIKKVIFPIAILIVMIGAIVLATIGFKFGLIYQAHKRIEIYIDKEYSKEEVIDIVKGILPDEKIIAQDIETFNKDFSLTVKNISDDKAKELKAKINEKYELKDGTESVVIVSEPHTRMRDIMKPYVTPLVISTLIILVYLLIRFRKNGLVNSGVMPITSIIIMQALYFSIIAICRIPVSKLTMPISLLVYIATIITVIITLQKLNKNLNK